MKQSHTFGIELTIKEAANYLDMSVDKLQLLRAQGKITVYKFRGKFKLLQSELDIFLEKQK